MSALHIYNSLTRRVEPFEPAEPGRIRIYVCGMTTYDYCHIGHARSMIAFDMVVRWLRESGFNVTYVRNHTDVDDKIIARAAELGEHPLALSARFIDALDEDLGRLGLLSPDVQPKVSDHIAEIIALIEQLVARGHAYALDGDVYFSVTSDPSYGQLSGKRLDDLRAGERVDIDGRKRHPGDFALWKSAKPDEGAVWPSPWGPGRPGWHIECSAMASRYLGDTFDIHGGGIDLIFPHHENEIAQSECGTGHRPFARYWMHNGHLTMDGDKMSKSLGNFVRIRDILQEVPYEALRMLYLDSHYRSPLPYSSTRLGEAMVALDRLYQAKETLLEMAAGGGGTAEEVAKTYGSAAAELRAAAERFPAAFAEACNDDFNSAAAVGLVYELTRLVNHFGNNKKARAKSAALAGPALDAFALAGRVRGSGGREPDAWCADVRSLRLAALGKTEAELAALVTARDAARTARDWSEADRLRDELAAMGVVLMDGPTGTAWRMRV